MLAQPISPASHGENPQATEKVLLEHWSKDRPAGHAASLAQLANENQWLKAGDVVYVTETRRHVLTDAELDAAARAVIGGES